MRGFRLPLPALLLILALIFAAGAGYFATLQNIWIDESTQLSGLTLAPLALLRWLGGQPVPFGVPADRMPPISYLVDGACWRTICNSPFAFRILHLLVALAGICTIAGLLYRRYGALPALVGGLLLVTSPKLIEAAVEIRAYPLFFALTCAQIALFFRLFDRPKLDGRLLIAFFLLSVVTLYTHFFGLVSSAAFCTGLLIGRGRTVRDATAIIGLGVAILVAALGLLPFITGAVGASDMGAEPMSLTPFGLLTFLLRLLGHSSTMLSPVVATVYLATFVLLPPMAIAGVVQKQRGLPAILGDPLVALGIALLAGLGATVLAALLVQGFNPLKPSYSIWALPLFATLAGAACAPMAGGPWLRRGVAALATLSLLAALWGCVAFLRHAHWFVHGPEAAIAAEIGADPTRTAVIYQGQRWSYGYFPLHYRAHGRLAQWIATPDGLLHRINPGGVIAPQGIDPQALGNYDRVLLVDIHLATYRTLRRLAAAPSSAPFPPPRADAIAGIFTLSPYWIAQKRLVQPGIYWLSLQRFDRRNSR
jgi:hypothetical protein